jgi:hypothetical protein
MGASPLISETNLRLTKNINDQHISVNPFKIAEIPENEMNRHRRTCPDIANGPAAGGFAPD